MSNIKARINQQNQIVASKVEVNTAGINLGDLTDVTLTTPDDGSYIVYDSDTNTFLDDQTIVKTDTGISLTGTLNVTQDIDVDGTLEADAITVNGITLSETIADTVGAMVTSNSESGISVIYEDNDNTLDFNVDDFTITLTGDVNGSGTVTDLANVEISTTIQSASIEPDSVALGTDTTGDYVSTITAGIGIDSTGATSGEDIAHTLSVDLNQLNTETSIEQADFVTMVDATDDGSGKITFSDLEDTIFGNVSGDINIAAGGEATIQATSVENSMLAGSIENSKLSNSTVSYGGVQLSLGGIDDTPAFDLQDATNLPATRLTGSMPDDRIPLSNVTQHQESLSIATTQLTGTITNAQLAGSITNDKLVNSSITVSDGTNTSDISLGSTLTFSGTANEVDVSESAGTVTFGLPDDVTITGNLTVNGTTTTINSTTLSVEDKNIELGSVGTPTDTTADGGGITLKGATDKTFNWIDSTDSWTSSENLDLASGKTYKIDGTDVLSNDTLGTGVVTSSLTTVGALDAGSITSNFGDIDIGDNVVTAEEFIGDLRGAIRFQAKAGEALTKGDVVYISSVNGQTPIVSKALSSDVDKMPAFGLANRTVNNNASLEVISFGTFTKGDTSGGLENWEIGDVLYVSANTAGALTNVKPTGSGNLLQNVGKVERVHESSGSIMVAGAGRTNATPNLDDGKFFIGNSSNEASDDGEFNGDFTNADGVISITNASTWNGKQDALTFGIADTNTVKIDSNNVTDDEYARFTANGLEGRKNSEVLSDIGAQAELTSSSDVTINKLGVTEIDGPTNGLLTLNANSLEIISTEPSSTLNEMPVLALYREGTGAAIDNSEIGSVRYFGKDAQNQKVFYAGIYAEVDDEGSVTQDGKHRGTIKFHVADGNGGEVNVPSPIDDIAGDKDPVVTLNSGGLTFGGQGNINFNNQTSNLKWSNNLDTGNDQKLFGRQNDVGDVDSDIYLPDKESGTLAITNNETFTGGMTVEGGITGHQTSTVVSTAQTATNFYGKRLIHTGGAVTYTFAATGTISSGSDVGKTVTVVNAGTDTITCNITTSKFYNMIAGVNADLSGSGVASVTIYKGGLAEFVVTETNKVLVFGAGVST